MAKLLSAQHAANNICLHWRQAGFEFGMSPLGSNVGREFGCDTTSLPIAALYVFVDEYIALLRYTTYYFLSAVADSGQRAMVFNRLAVTQLRTVAAIRALCGLGLDGNARLQLRLLYENSLLWARLRIDTDVLKEFQTANTPELSNSFWHKYISREKNERWLESQFKENRITWLGELDSVVAELKRKISTSAHPSFLQAYFETLHDWNDIDDRMVVGSPTNASHFTLSMTLFATAIPFALFPDPSYGIIATDIRPHTSWQPNYTEPVDWETYNQKLRSMFPRLFLASIRFAKELAAEGATG